MREYTPDAWVLVELEAQGKKITKVLAGWYGGYTQGDSWKLSSGVEKIEEDGDQWIFTNHSGSVYRCHRHTERMSGYMSSVYAGFVKQMEELGGTIKVVDACNMVEAPTEGNAKHSG